MLSSVTGQNDQWALFAAQQTSSTAQPAQVGGASFANQGTVAADVSAVSPVAGGSSSPLSSDTNMWLMMFGGGSDASSGGGATSGSGSIFADLPSLMSALTGTSSAGASASTDAMGSNGTAAATDGSGSLSGQLLQDLDTMSAKLGTIAAGFGGMQPPPPPAGGGSTGPSGAADDANTAAIGWGDGPAGPGGGWQQFLAAYQAGDQSAASRATALPTISA